MKNQLVFTRLIAKSIAFSLLLLSAATGFAQGTFSTSNVTFTPDTGHFGDTTSFTATITNISTTMYSGTLHINYTTDTTFSLQSSCTAQVILNPNGANSVINTCTILFDQSFFHPGSNIVVIWSSGNARPAADTVWTHIFIDTTAAGIHETNLNTSFSISPSPAKDFIAVKINKLALNKNTPQQVRITDIFGRTIYTEQFSNSEEQKINIQNLPPGFYFLELRYGNNKRGVQKFVKSD